MLQNSNLFFCRDQNEDRSDFKSQEAVIRFVKSLDIPIICNAMLYEKNKNTLEHWGADIVRPRWPITFLTLEELIKYSKKKDNKTEIPMYKFPHL